MKFLKTFGGGSSPANGNQPPSRFSASGRPLRPGNRPGQSFGAETNAERGKRGAPPYRRGNQPPPRAGARVR
jgi:hypothetical protein